MFNKFYKKIFLQDYVSLYLKYLVYPNIKNGRTRTNYILTTDVILVCI